MWGKEQWAKVARDWASMPADSQSHRVLGSILDVHSRLELMEQRLEELTGHLEADRRLAALKAAREHVDGLPSEKSNERGYRDRAMPAADRIARELSVARFLLGGRE